MARSGFIRTDRQHLKQLLAECEAEWKALNREVNRIDRVRMHATPGETFPLNRCDQIK